MKQSDKARLAVLDAAAEEIDRLNMRSDLIRVVPVLKVDVPGWPTSDSPDGWPSDLYLVTYKCKGVISIRNDGSPIYADRHEMALYLPKEYPALEPKLAWITPIWHPNIEHAGARHVCTDAPETWRALRPLDDLLVFIGEMVQYRRYHAVHERPWPLDAEVAKWVLEVAEPQGLISKDKPVDNRPLERPWGMKSRAGMDAATAAPTPQPSPVSAAPVPQANPPRGTMRFGTAVPVVKVANAPAAPAPADSGAPIKPTSPVRAMTFGPPTRLSQTND